MCIIDDRVKEIIKGMPPAQARETKISFAFNSIIKYEPILFFKKPKRVSDWLKKLHNVPRMVRGQHMDHEILEARIEQRHSYLLVKLKRDASCAGMYGTQTCRVWCRFPTPPKYQTLLSAGFQSKESNKRRLGRLLKFLTSYQDHADVQSENKIELALVFKRSNDGPSLPEPPVRKRRRRKVVRPHYTEYYKEFQMPRKDVAVVTACTACGNCVRFCPQGAIKMRGGAEVDWIKCDGCKKCIQTCSFNAIWIEQRVVKDEPGPDDTIDDSPLDIPWQTMIQKVQSPVDVMDSQYPINQNVFDTASTTG